jgi:hypothetical protein
MTSPSPISSSAMNPGSRMRRGSRSDLFRVSDLDFFVFVIRFGTHASGVLDRVSFESTPEACVPVQA